MTELDRTQQRIIGALIEKELAVPDSYPLTENALIAACNQKSNRDPEMALEQFEVHGALLALMTDGWAKSTTGGRASRHSHRLESQYAVDEREKAVLCELLIRGPQAPGALKPRVARLGFKATPAEIEEVLHEMAAKIVPMVEQLPRRPRERDHRWRHLIGPMDPAHEAEAAGQQPTDSSHDAPAPAPAVTAPAVTTPAVTAPAVTTPAVTTPAAAADADLSGRVARLEARMTELEAELRRLHGTGPAD